MLHQIGLEKAADLFATVPEKLRLTRDLDTPAALSELELLAGFDQMAARNPGAQRASFLGAGFLRAAFFRIGCIFISR